LTTFIANADPAGHISGRRWHGGGGRKPLSHTGGWVGSGNRTWSLLMDVCLMDTSTGLTNGRPRGNLACGGVEACLNEVLALWLSDERLKLGGCESVD
jgi:hypothetical protein